LLTEKRGNLRDGLHARNTGEENGDGTLDRDEEKKFNIPETGKNGMGGGKRTGVEE